MHWQNGCTVLIAPRGRVIAADHTRNKRQRRHSRDAFKSYRHEQAESDHHSGPINANGGMAAGTRDFCLGAAAGHFRVLPNVLKTDWPNNIGKGYIIVGTFRDQPTRAFRCQFGAQGDFHGVFQ
ncbi:hypothetical protein CLV78_107161 [Aliiruegeria haliotis]|uniref:Uncharacterized protein n=1 Tax=Aliiruegeria haliotis TaxID=1280846 RepID=A0A2T0RM77_9RHOB|nr:hypothetical protein [Aliiruegeria haliotis]PRY22237.1 hypothetical protein CLV78_107161 [Aliiruegeria haliotis]